jgi:hypothetical protein
MGKPMKKSGKWIAGELGKSLGLATNEKDVEHAYWHAFESYYPSCIASPLKTDGILESGDLTALMEFKYNLNFKSKLDVATVVIQALFYLKRMERQGKPIPKSVFVGDKNECFCVNVVPPVAKYLVTDGIDWSGAASKAAENYPAVVKQIAEDNEIAPFVYDIDPKLDFDEVVEKMRAFQKGEGYAITITKDNIVEIFRYFSRNVVKDSRYDANTLFDDHNSDMAAKLASIFTTCLTDRDSAYIHPKKRNVLVVRGEEIKVNGNLFKGFFGHFRQTYTSSELETIVANKDRILSEMYRRRTGAFFTPTLWVQEAHKMLSESLGAGWRDEYVVWDCCCGTANLTRDAKFSELYLSTLEQGDIDSIGDMGFNREAKAVFKYDFLGETGLDGVPEALREAFKGGKKVLFLINPPYGTANELGAIATHGKHKGGIAQNKINEVMKTDGMGKSCQQLYAQFLYRIAKLQEQHPLLAVGIFCPPLLMSGSSITDVRTLWYANFKFNGGMLFQASNFADVSENWGISFTVWSPGKQKDDPILTVCELDTDNFKIKHSGSKMACPANGNGASQWVREGALIGEGEDAPQLGSSVTVKNDGRGKLVRDSLAYMTNVSNNVYKNGDGVFLTSSCSSMANGLSVLPANFRRCIALFLARKSIKPDWINCKDEYLVPHAADPASALNAEYEQWVNDAIVYALCNTSSQQSSLRGIQYKGKSWDIKNSFFFMPVAEMKALADKAGFTEMYQDAKAGGDSYVQKLLESVKLSDDAKAVLEAARELVRKSMAIREEWHGSHPEHHLQAFDAGWAQLKPLMKQHFKVDYEAFIALYKTFENRVREGVVKFGFLK